MSGQTSVRHAGNIIHPSALNSSASDTKPIYICSNCKKCFYTKIQYDNHRGSKNMCDNIKKLRDVIRQRLFHKS